jgi:acyl-CoA dehydrogenase
LDKLLSAGDLAFKERCIGYAKNELAPLSKELGEIDHVPDALKRSLGSAGIFRPIFPELHGGTGVSAVRICLAREAVAGVYGPADTTLAMQGLGGTPIVLAGDEDQKKHYLPCLASGETLSTFCLTEPEAGSDVAAISTTAERSGDFFVINGRKRFISNGFSADLGILFAKTPSEGQRERDRLSAFIVERSLPGWKVSRRIELMASHDIVEFELDGLEIPAGRLLGSAGGGFKLAMQTLDLMRMTVGAAAVGMAAAGLRESIEYSGRRVQFGRRLEEFQATKFKLAEMVTEIEASRGLVYMAALKKDEKESDASVYSSMAKLYATEAAFRVIDQAVQIHGGVGVVRGSVVERLYREIRPLRVYEGTSEIQKLIISHHLLRKERASETGNNQRIDPKGENL